MQRQHSFIYLAAEIAGKKIKGFFKGELIENHRYL